MEPGARRISNIFNKTTAFDVCLNLPPVLAAAHYLLGEIKLHGANLRDPTRATATRRCMWMCPNALRMTGGC